MVYETGKIRTDRGLFIDKGNYACDPRHEDYDGGLREDNTAARNGAALRACISDATTRNVPVQIPEGTYAFDGLSLTVACEVRGAGKGETILNYEGSGVGITISGTGDGRTILRGFSLVDSGGTGTNGLQISRRAEVSDVTVDGFQTRNVYLLTGANPDTEAPYFSHFRRCTIQNSGGPGIELSSTCNGVKFEQCDVKNNGAEGYLIGQSENVMVMGGQAAYNVREGLKTVGTAYLLVHGLYGEGNNSGGAGAGAASFDATTNNCLVHFGNFQGTLSVSSTDAMIVTRGGAHQAQMPLNLRRLDFGDDGAGSATMGPAAVGDFQGVLDITCLGDVQDFNVNLGGQLGFGVKPNGVKLRMSTASAVSTINRVSLVYDQAGNAVGYIPIYTNFTP